MPLAAGRRQMFAHLQNFMKTQTQRTTIGASGARAGFCCLTATLTAGLTELGLLFMTSSPFDKTG